MFLYLLLALDVLAWLVVVLAVFCLPRRHVVRARITAAGEHLTLNLVGSEQIVANAASRTLSGIVVKFGVPGHTSRGLLKVAPGALEFPDDLGVVKLTREHERNNSRGHLTSLDVNGERIRASLRVSDGPDGDSALREAQDRTRDGLSFDIVDATVVGDTITAGRVVAIGQVGIPAYTDGRIDTIAAAHEEGTHMLTKQERARLNLLRAKQNALTAEEAAELNALAAKAGGPDAGEDLVDVSTIPAPPASSSAPASAAAPAAPAAGQQVAASLSAVPGGIPAPAAASTATQPQGGALGQLYADVTAAFVARKAGDHQTAAATITAALSDITKSAHMGNVVPPAWSGELWSGLVYEPVFSDLFSSGDLTAMTGTGWRFTDKMVIADYAGDKAAVPSDTVTTETQSYSVSRMAVGVDIDRAYFDFGVDGFVQALFEQVRESWEIKLDAKVAAYVLANMVTAKDVEPGGAALDAFPSILKAAAAAVRALKRRRVGKASWVMVNDDDLFTLFDVSAKDVSAFLDLFDIDPRNFRADPSITAGKVVAGVKQAATVRTLPGSPIRVDALDLVKGGVDEAFFGYWAIEEHHTSGIAVADYEAPAEA